jgi:hypothetical protein
MIKKIIIVFIVISLIFLSKKYYYQKWIGYELIPEASSMDEHDYPVAGYTFRNTGVSLGWSTMNIYKILDDKYPNSSTGYDNLNITVNGQSPSFKNRKMFNYPLTRAIDVDIGKGTETIRIVQPFLDHPPLGSILFSLTTKNPKKFDDFQVKDIRLVSLYAATITAILLFIFSYQLYHKLLISYFSFFIYSTVTTYILVSRFALFENLIIPFYLFSHIILLYSFRCKPKTKYLFYIISGVIVGLGYLIKEIAIFSLFSGLIILICRREKLKNILYYFLPTLIIIGSYYLYSYLLAPELTLKLLFDQANRGFFGPLSFLYSIYQPKIKYFPLEGYWLWGLISILYLGFSDLKKHFVLTAGFLSFLVCYLILAGLNYPWYSFPFIPFFIIASSYLVYTLIVSPAVVNLFLFFLLPFSSSFYWGYILYHPKANLVSLYRGFLLGLISLFFFRKIFSSKYPILKIAWPVFMLIILYFLNRWNQKSLIYIISNWGNLPLAVDQVK